MKKILSIMLAAAAMVTSLALPASAVEAPASVTPAQLSSTIGDTVTITYDDPAIDGEGVMENVAVPCAALDSRAKVYVNAPVAGKYSIQYTGTYNVYSRKLFIYVNGTQQVEVPFSWSSQTPGETPNLVPGYHDTTYANVGLGAAQTITLDEGVNLIQVSRGTNLNDSNPQQVFTQLTLKLIEPAAQIGTISQSVLKPYMGDPFTLSAVVTDNAPGVSVSYKVGEGAETAMTAGADNTYTASLSLATVGDNTITIKATDAAGFVTTKTHTITAVDYKSSAMAIATAPSTADPTNKTTYTGTLTFTNSSASDIQTCLLIAVYDSSNKLVGLNKVDTLAAAGGDTPLSVSVDVDNGTYTVELMLWDDIWGMNDIMTDPYVAP